MSSRKETLWFNVHKMINVPLRENGEVARRGWDPSKMQCHLLLVKEGRKGGRTEGREGGNI